MDFQNVELKRGRPRKNEQSSKVWENKEYVAGYNKKYYEKNKSKEIECPECLKMVQEGYLEKHKETSYHVNFMKAIEKQKQKDQHENRFKSDLDFGTDVMVEYSTAGPPKQNKIL
jgi:hypothetical protein